MKKPWYLRRTKRKPGKDATGIAIRALPASCWRSPVRNWWMSFRRVDNGEVERSRASGKTYVEVVALRDARMATGRYEVGWFGEEVEQ